MDDLINVLDSIINLLTYPFLSVRVLNAIICVVFPCICQANECLRLEPVLAHDDKVSEEACEGLNHSQLPV